MTEKLDTSLSPETSERWADLACRVACKGDHLELAAMRKPRRSGVSYQADDGDRTRDPQLGKLMLYRLSYVRSPTPKIAQ
jgi:hypothetical protein